MTALGQAFLLWTEAHPGFALLILYLAAALDAVFLIGVFVPAGLVLFAIGALVALDVLSFWPAVLIAAAGGLSGDLFSFALGRRYRQRLFEHAWLQRRAAVVARAQGFFAQHGGKGVMAARFLGPLRAILPAVAGASPMPLWLFLLADGVAALVWACAYILPGVVFGASIGLAAQVAGRLALLLVLFAVLVWGVFALTRLVLQAMSTRAEHWIGRMLDWSRRHRRLGSFGAALADPTQPETPVLALIALVLGGLGALALYLIAAPALHAYPWPTDAAIFQSLRDLHTPYGVAIASALLHLGEWPVYLPVAAVMLATLILQRKPRAAAHWLAALAFGGVLSLALDQVPTVDAPYAYFGLPPPPGFSARDLVLTTVIYGLIPVLLSTRQPASLRTWFYGVAISLLALITASRLYLGAQWFSHAAIFVVIGLLWTALLGLGFRRHRAMPVALPVTLVPVLITLVLAASLQGSLGGRSLLPASAMAAARSGFTWSEWQQGAYTQFATQRHDVAGRPKQPLNLQWAGSLDTIAHQLQQEGWETPPTVASAQTLRWLSDTARLETLPVLPQVHNGERQALVLRRRIDADQQWLLRLWPASARFDDGTPLWLGSLSLQVPRSAYLGLLRLPIAVASVSPDPLLRPAAPLMRPVDDLYLLTTPDARSESRHDG